MNENEESVYSLMGFDPILLLDEPPLNDNYTVNIIRPGEDSQEELEGKKSISTQENKEKKIINSNKSIKNTDKTIVRLKNKHSIEQNQINFEEGLDVKIEKNEEDFNEKANELSSNNIILDNDKIELISNESTEVDDDPRRKRRRSSASS